MTERLMVADLKSAMARKGRVGSNPTPAASLLCGGGANGKHTETLDFILIVCHRACVESQLDKRRKVVV